MLYILRFTRKTNLNTKLSDFLTFLYLVRTFVFWVLQFGFKYLFCRWRPVGLYEISYWCFSANSNLKSGRKPLVVSEQLVFVFYLHNPLLEGSCFSSLLWCRNQVLRQRYPARLQEGQCFEGRVGNGVVIGNNNNIRNYQVIYICLLSPGGNRERYELRRKSRQMTMKWLSIINMGKAVDQATGSRFNE